MSEYIVRRDSLVNVADEIRVLSGTTAEMGLDAMAENVAEANTEVTSQADLLIDLENALQGKSLPADPNLLPENIKSGVTLYGVEGNYEGDTYSLARSLLDGSITEYIDNEITEICGYAFYGRSSLRKVVVPNVEFIEIYTFYLCRYLEWLDLSNVEAVSNSAVWYCNSLKTLIFRGPVPSYVSSGASASFNFAQCYRMTGTVHSTYNPDGLQDGYIYVPSEYLADYQSAAGFSTVATQIRALEDYTVDGTVTGELDETKI